MKVRVDPERLKKYFPTYGIPWPKHLVDDKISSIVETSDYNPDNEYNITIDSYGRAILDVNNQNMYNSLENLLESIKVKQKETPLFYLIYMEFNRLIEEAQYWEDVRKYKSIYSKELSEILYNLRSFKANNDSIISITIKTKSDKIITIVNQDNVQDIIERLQEEYPNLIDDLEKILIYLGGSNPLINHPGKPIKEKQKAVKYLISCLKKFIDHFKIDYNSFTTPAQLTDKSPGTFLHDFLQITGLLNEIGWQSWDEKLKSHELRYDGKIHYCKRLEKY
jgi:hypothetical protein